MSIEIHTKEGAGILATFLDEQIAAFIALETTLRESPLARVARLHPLLVAVIEDAISIRLLGDASRLNQAYVISRALLERLINFCFLQLCTDGEFEDFLDYTLNKAGRRMDRSVEAAGQFKARIALRDGDFQLHPEIAAAVAKFTSERGREKTRWTTVSLPDRAAVVEARLGGASGLFISLLTIYADASEALHGTIYGAIFHLGAYDVGVVPYDQEILDRHRYSTLACLYLMAGGAMDTLLALLRELGEPSVFEAASASKSRFKLAAVMCGLVAVNKKLDPPRNTDARNEAAHAG